MRLPRAANSIMTRVLKSLVLLLPTHVRAVIVMGTPASHYDHYSSVRVELLDFYATFHTAANSTSEQLIVVADDYVSGRQPESFYSALADARQVPDKDLLPFALDDVWMRDSFVFQLAADVLVRFEFAPAYLDFTTVRFIDQSASRLAGLVWGDALAQVPLVLAGWPAG